MSAIRSRDTRPERLVRSLLHTAGFRFRLNRHSLPGSPDIVLPKWGAVVFVHGCYWHGHGCARGGTGAKSNQHYWAPKIQRTQNRDRLNHVRLESEGWKVITVWECELSDPAYVLERLKKELHGLIQTPG